MDVVMAMPTETSQHLWLLLVLLLRKGEASGLVVGPLLQE
jgi:hypothetical protein